VQQGVRTEYRFEIGYIPPRTQQHARSHQLVAFLPDLLERAPKPMGSRGVGILAAEGEEFFGLAQLHFGRCVIRLPDLQQFQSPPQNHSRRFHAAL
jgi:hypothetical protein